MPVTALVLGNNDTDRNKSILTKSKPVLKHDLLCERQFVKNVVNYTLGLKDYYYSVQPSFNEVKGYI